MLNTTRFATAFAMTAMLFSQTKPMRPSYKVLTPTTQDNLTIFPIVTNYAPDTHEFLTLDEGLRSGQVVVTEAGGPPGLVRPRGPMPERPIPQGGAQVNTLLLTNNSGRPLILLAGEIVTGGKQDRVVGKDRIIRPKSDPIDLGVFCVEPHRWVETSDRFGGLGFSMAQPSVRSKAMAEKDQQAVWNEVAKSRAGVAAATPHAAPALQGTSSYAATMENSAVQRRVDSVAAPLERELREKQAVGAVVAVNGEIVWADVFASPSLLDKYWPKLIRSYAAEVVAGHPRETKLYAPSARDAQRFLDDFNARRESVESEPGVYRNTEIVGLNFDAFILTSLLSGAPFDLHIAKMKQ